MDDFEFIEDYKKMKSIKQICEKAGVNYKMLLQNKTTEEKTKKVAEICKVEIVKMYTKILSGGN